MEYRILGKTGLRVSTVGVGCWQMGGVVDGKGWPGTTDDESIATIHRAQDLGVNLLDTAPTYGDGHSEEVVGKALKGRRDRFILATKARPITDDPDEGKARRCILDLVDGSLRRLQTDCIDVYQLHAVPHDNTMPIVMETLADLKAQGKIRWYGISTNEVDAIRKLLTLGDLATVQVGYNILSRSGEEALRLAAAENLGALIRVPLASGALSGKYYNTVPKLDGEDKRLEQFTSESMVARFKELPRLLFLTEDGRRTMVQAALRFILDTVGVTSVIPGAKSRAQLEENAGTAEVPSLTAEERAKATAIADEVVGS